MQKIEDKSVMVNNSININTTTNKDFLDKIDVSLQFDSVKAMPKTAKNKTKKLKTKLEDEQTLQTNESTNKSITRSLNKRSKRRSK